MDKERQRKLEARARRQASLNSRNPAEAITEVEKPKDEVRQTKVKPILEPKAKKTGTKKVIKEEKKGAVKKHNSKVGKK